MRLIEIIADHFILEKQRDGLAFWLLGSVKICYSSCSIVPAIVPVYHTFPTEGTWQQYSANAIFEQTSDVGIISFVILVYSALSFLR